MDKKKIIIIAACGAAALVVTALLIILSGMPRTPRAAKPSPTQPAAQPAQPPEATAPPYMPQTQPPAPATAPPAPAAPAFPIDGAETLFSFSDNLPAKSQLPAGCFYVVEYWFPGREYPIKAYRYLGYDPPDIDYSQAKGAWWIMSSAAIARGYNQQWRDGRLSDGNTPILQDNIG